MFLIDTNVISEMRKFDRDRGDPNVRRWAASVSLDTLFLSVITVQEVELGVLLLHRRDPASAVALRQWLHGYILSAFSGRILPVDLAVARRSAPLHVPDRRQAHDALIAATALVHGLTLVTRNESDFRSTGTTLLNPWHASQSPRE